MEDFVSYWDRVRPPTYIQEPEEYDGSPSICIACTQTALKPSEQNALVARWCKLLPTLRHVSRVWFVSRVPQRLFDAACQMPALSDLWIKWSAIKDISTITLIKGLRHFYLGSSAQVVSLDSLAVHTRLETLHLMNISKVRDVGFVSALRNLREFGYTANLFNWIHIDSLAPLMNLRRLQHLDLRGARITDGSLRPIATLRALESAVLANVFALEEYAYLYVNLPQLQPMLPAFEPEGRSCRKCKQDSMVSPIAAGQTSLCRFCDAAALVAHGDRYNALIERFKSARGVK